MSLRRFVDGYEGAERALVLANRSQPEQLRSMLAGVFERQSVRVDEAVVEGVPDDTVLLLDGTGSVVARSPLDAVSASLLFTNSDAFITGSTGLDEIELPDVISGLEGVNFRLRGFPRSHKEKLLLIAVSRQIERTAWAHDDGTHRASFQRLSRIVDEQGTQRVYRRLGESDVDTHVYGVDDGDVDWSAELEVTVHTGESPDYRDSWFVIYRPPEAEQPGTPDPFALLAVQDDDGVWDGFFTSGPEEALAVDDYVRRSL
ncbi:histidine kinase [Halolamina sp. CBA1230]|uniref:DICT sensory domain-containing protein n=1 Tax=Halolamina sp. CBA1230 TaxID=1853690 RepID=UPI0009A192D3|nr:DICT sensory domain-containing protein [Halolamina sp. CBA1230]QKY18986.1 histidine kinase [Halolamina sp. CBA1230]